MKKYLNTSGKTGCKYIIHCNINKTKTAMNIPPGQLRLFLDTRELPPVLYLPLGLSPNATSTDSIKLCKKWG